MQTNLSQATKYARAGFSVIPVYPADHPDEGRRKTATISWKTYQSRIATDTELNQMFKKVYDLAIICGAVSGHLEVIDFDDPTLFDPFLKAVRGHDAALGGKLTTHQVTPSGGAHLLYRCTDPVTGNQKLAMTEDGKSVLIETRGSGGYFLIEPSRGYELHGNLEQLPVITKTERELLLWIAKGFDRRSHGTETPRTDPTGDRPGDIFNRRAEWPELLEADGWSIVGNIGDRVHWTRPGKKAGTSATLHPEKGLFVFSTSTVLPSEKPLNKFGYLALFRFNGDFGEAARYVRGLYQEEFVNNHSLKSLSSLNSPDISSATTDEDLSIRQWPILDERALYGFAGRFVRFATENSEADPAAVLATFLVRFGVEIPQAFLWVGDSKHRPNICSVLVGSSSKARKGTSGKPVTRLFEPLVQRGTDLTDRARISPGPFSSGEGVIYAVRDPVMGTDKQSGQPTQIDPGVEDKRLFILDEEFGGVISQTKREGNTLSAIIRMIWDSGNLDPLTKTTKIKATGAHIGWVSHITLFELISRLSETESLNGFGNRILWVCARRGKLVAWPEPMNPDRLILFQNELSEIINSHQGDGNTVPNSDVKQAWQDRYYPELTQERPGLAGCLVNRAEVQVLRLSLIYALLDKSRTIRMEHLEAAYAMWRYCEDSVMYIFEGRQTDNVGQTIVDALQDGPMTGTDLFKLFSNHITRKRLKNTLKELEAAGKIGVMQESTGGRPRSTYFLKAAGEKSELGQKSTGEQPA